MLACCLNIPPNDGIFVMKKIKCLRISAVKNKVPHYFFKKKVNCIIISSKHKSSSLFLSAKIKHLIISSEKIKQLITSSEKNQAPHYFLTKKTDFF